MGIWASGLRVHVCLAGGFSIPRKVGHHQDKMVLQVLANLREHMYLLSRRYVFVIANMRICYATMCICQIHRSTFCPSHFGLTILVSPCSFPLHTRRTFTAHPAKHVKLSRAGLPRARSAGTSEDWAGRGREGERERARGREREPTKHTQVLRESGEQTRTSVIGVH